MSTIDVVIGAGPVGRAVIAVLGEQGRAVRLITRSGPPAGPGEGPGAMGPGVQWVAADAANPAALRPLLAGAGTIYHCAHSATYSARTWREQLIPTEAAVLAASPTLVVFPESLYSYTATTHPMSEKGPRDARGGKRGVRTELLAARAASPTPTISVVASDYFGPGAGPGAHAGEAMLTAVMHSSVLQVLGSPDQAHSFTYLPDMARAMVTAGQRQDLRGAVLHAPTGPAITQRQMAAALAHAAAKPTPPLQTMQLPPAGDGAPDWVEELEDMRHQFTAPFIIDSTHTQTLLDLSPTPLHQAAAATVASWHAHHPTPQPPQKG